MAGGRGAGEGARGRWPEDVGIISGKKTREKYKKRKRRWKG